MVNKIECYAKSKPLTNISCKPWKINKVKRLPLNKLLQTLGIQKDIPYKITYFGIKKEEWHTGILILGYAKPMVLVGL